MNERVGVLIFLIGKKFADLMGDEGSKERATILDTIDKHHFVELYSQKARGDVAPNVRVEHEGTRLTGLYLREFVAELMDLLQPSLSKALSKQKDMVEKIYGPNLVVSLAGVRLPEYQKI